MQCFLSKERCVTLSIVMLDDTEVLHSISLNQIGTAFLTGIAKSVQVNHFEYFGLKYFDRFHKPQWIILNKSLYKQLKRNDAEKSVAISTNKMPIFKLYFEVRFYPRDPTSIDNENFRYQIFLQIRKDMSNQKFVIKDDKEFAFLCGLILQSDFGDFHSSRFAPNYIKQAVNAHLLTSQNEEMIRQAHMKLKGLEPIDAEYQFLEKIRWFENYGAIIFPVKDRYGRNCYLSLNPQGYALRYRKDQKFNYDIFWPRVSNIKRKALRITIKEKCDTVKYHHFVSGDKNLAVALYQLSLDQFNFFKLKKDEKPTIKEPVKRTFGQRLSNEFGYNSDTSGENYQLSDDTFSSYPDSINTTHSTQNIKTFKKPKLAQRNCISDAEESALSKKHRRVIMSKSQTETEDESIKAFNPSLSRSGKLLSDNQISSGNVFRKPATSYDRIPPDYIYENKRTNIQSVESVRPRQRKLRKKASSQQNNSNHRKHSEHKAMDLPIRNNVTTNSSIKDVHQIPFTNVKTQDVNYQIIRTKHGGSFEAKAKIRRKLPTADNDINREIIPHSSEPANNSISIQIPRLQSNQDPHRTSPSKRVLPDLSQIPSNPPVPLHRNNNLTQTKQPAINYKSAYPPPRRTSRTSQKPVLLPSNSQTSLARSKLIQSGI